MIQERFAAQAKNILIEDPSVVGLAVGGSWLTNEIDEFSDLDLILVTENLVSTDPNKMLAYADRLGKLLNGFTGEHVGEPRVLICLYDDPLLHVDIKFLTMDELGHRVETPEILFDREGQMQREFDKEKAQFPKPGYQWIEDRFWIWVHYALLKIGRGEYMEAVDFFGFMRMVVFGPLLHIKNGNLPRAVRKVETMLEKDDFLKLKSTIPSYDKKSILEALKSSIELYQELRSSLFDEKIVLRKETEEKVLNYLSEFN